MTSTPELGGVMAGTIGTRPSQVKRVRRLLIMAGVAALFTAPVLVDTAAMLRTAVPFTEVNVPPRYACEQSGQG